MINDCKDNTYFLSHKIVFFILTSFAWPVQGNIVILHPTPLEISTFHPQTFTKK